MGRGCGRPSAEGRGRGWGRDAPSPAANLIISFCKFAWPWLWPRLLGMRSNCNQRPSTPSSCSSSSSSFSPPTPHGCPPPQSGSQSTASSTAGAQEGPLGSERRMEAPAPPPNPPRAPPGSQVWHPVGKSGAWDEARLSCSNPHLIQMAVRAAHTFLKIQCGNPVHCSSPLK
jgi:hypothetical protein